MASFFFAVPTCGANYVFGLTEAGDVCAALLGFREKHPAAAMMVYSFPDERLAPLLYAGALATADSRAMEQKGSGVLLLESGAMVMRGDAASGATAQLDLARAVAAAAGVEMRVSWLDSTAAASEQGRGGRVSDPPLDECVRRVSLPRASVYPSAPPKAMDNPRTVSCTDLAGFETPKAKWFLGF